MKITKKYIQKLILEEFTREALEHADPAAAIAKAQAGLEEIRSRLEGMAVGQDISPERVLGMVDEVALRLSLASEALAGAGSQSMDSMDPL